MIRIKASFPALLAGLAVLLLAAACSEPTPTPTPVPAADVTAVQAAAPVIMVATEAPPATAMPTPTGTPTLAAPVTLTVSETLNIRSGPGIAYPVVGALLADDVATVIGVSPDGKWWKLNCPTDIEADQCWVIGDPQYSAVDAAVAALADATAPAVPSPTLTPTATPCIASAPPGWSAYLVRSGDTLSGLAQRTGAGVAELQSANCLESDIIVEGRTLFVPGGLAVQPASAGPGSDTSSNSHGGVWLDQASLNEELAGVLGFVPPGGGRFCRAVTTAASPNFKIGAANAGAESSQGTTWEVGQAFGICLNGVQSADVLTLTVQPPSAEAIKLMVPGNAPALRWVVGPDDPRGLYRVTWSQLSATFEVVETITEPRIAIFSRSPSIYEVSEGQYVDFVAAGYEPGRLALYVCRDQTPMVCYTLRNVIVGANRSGLWSFSTKGLNAGRYVLSDGIDTRLIPLNDPRVFRVTEP